jgi:hypothetical protein
MPHFDRVTGLDDDSFGLDELVADGAAVHVERMSRDHVWMCVTAGDQTYTLNFHIRKRTIWVNVEKRD